NKWKSIIDGHERR
ncbi:3'5'-cyclic nucleotide phosphodiesterase domain-containing protein, partial [Toxoplasma gondii TgCatPRC2]